jgi:hypothetical protein
LKTAPVQPPAAFYHKDLGEFVLPYEAVRAEGDRALLAFLESSYAAAADLARWDRAALERQHVPGWFPRMEAWRERRAGCDRSGRTRANRGR